MRECECDWMRCIAPGVSNPCACLCHSDSDRSLMERSRNQRMLERCSDCRWNVVACGKGLCYCSCHGDRPPAPAPEPVVAAGHDQFGTERAFERVRVVRSAEPDLDVLLALRDEYHSGTHPEWTIGGA